MIRYLLPAALLAASLHAQEHHPPAPPPPPKGPQATYYWCSHQQDWFVYQYKHVKPARQDTDRTFP